MMKLLKTNEAIRLDGQGTRINKLGSIRETRQNMPSFDMTIAMNEKKIADERIFGAGS
jgi:hypothetical protein